MIARLGSMRTSRCRGALFAGAILAACGAAAPGPASGPPPRPVDPAAITVFADRPLGDAVQIGDFLGAGGAVTDERIDTAWREVGFRHTHTEVLSAEGDEAWLGISRGRAGIEIDFTRYDRHLDRYLRVLSRRPLVNLGDIPRVLSAQPGRGAVADHATFGGSDYSAHMPRDLEEWSALCRAVVRHNVERGLRGLVYATPSEPDFPGRFRYHPDDDASTQLPNHIRLYVATYRAVKETDPTARVGGPATMCWQVTPSTANAAFGLSDWLAALASHNRTSAETAGLDYVSWQDYAWASERISHGADAVRRMLAENGFDPATPIILAGSGWGTWSTNYGETDEDLPHHRRASQIAMNLIREFDDPRERQFAFAHYYFFHTDDAWWAEDPENRAVFRRSGLVAYDAEGREERTPMFAAFQMAKAMADGGEIVETAAPEPLEAMAVRDPVSGRIVLTVNNHTADAISIPVEIREAPIGSDSIRRVVRTIDETRSGDGRGLEPGAVELVPRAEALSFPLALGPYATVQVSLEAR